MLDRRTFLAGLAAAGLVAGCRSGDDSGDDPAGGAGRAAGPGELPPLPEGLPGDLFALGVASGDPIADSVVLWTRLAADPMAVGGGLPDVPVPVRWEVARDEGFGEVVAEGDAVADPALAHSVHVDPGGLDADTWYWYRFRVGDEVSPVGRTRTAPAAGSDPGSFRFAFASCQNRQSGYWGAHEHLAAENLDLIVFLGDYVYEEDPIEDAVRVGETPAPVDLAGYRLRYGEYKSDPALQASHAGAPWLCTWDDHEVQNNYAGDVANRDDGTRVARDEFLARRAAAYQAYYEHMPVRIEAPDDGELTLHREVAWGSLARFFVLDTRQHRSDQACDVDLDVGPRCDDVGDDGRTMLGEAQEAWLGEALGASDATWNVLAQQVIVSKLEIPVGDVDVVNLDQWDGYPAARRRLVEQLTGVRNPVVVTGDIHASGVGVVTRDPDDPGSGALASELVGTSISSLFPAAYIDLVEAAVEASSTIRYAEARKRGYVVCQVTPEELRADFRYVSTTSTADGTEVETGATWVVRDGEPEPVEV